MKSLGTSRNASKVGAAAERARYWLRSMGVEIRVEEGETLIGRGDDCHVRLPDPAVSREHAKITLKNNELFVEDLASANGVYVNNERMRLSTRLRAGDRIGIGHCELVVYSDVGDVDAPTELAAPRPSQSSDRLKGTGALDAVIDTRRAGGIEPRPGPQRAQRGETGRRSVPPNDASRRSDAPRRSRPSAPDVGRRSAPPSSRQQAETLEYVGRMVEKMFAAGRMDAAKHLLSSHLQEVLNESRATRRVDARLAEVAGRYALKLANETLDSCWIDLCVELHITAGKLMTAEMVEQLVALREKAPLGSRNLLRQYELLLRARVDRMSPADRALVARIAFL